MTHGPQAPRSACGWRRMLPGLALAASSRLAGCATPPSGPRTEADSAVPSPTPPVAQTAPAENADVQRAQQWLQGDLPTSLKPRANVGLTPPTDLWERIRRGFAMPDLEGPLVRDREQWYASRPDYILRMTERSRRYLFHIVEELERRNMPTELALLPFIESAFNPEAVSTAKAAGMWQFMPATGKFFDLKQNLFRDDRRDVLESTRAALDYLQKLYGMFDDWHLALAAYNWGEGSVGRALARNKAKGLPLTYNDLNMPNETRYYVPKLQAVKNIVAQPEAFNTRLPLIRNHPYFKSVAIERDIDVVVAARLAEVSLEDFKALNPSMSRPVILAAGTPQVLLPWDNAAIFERNLQDHTRSRLATWTAWVAPRTMKVEEAASSVQMRADQLRSVNGIPPRMMVKAGSTLLVHRQGSLDNDVTEHLADNAQLALAPEIVLRKVMVTARKGDTLASLAARHGVTAANMASWNQLKLVSALKPGQSLAVWVPTQGDRPGVRVAGNARHGKARGATPQRPVSTKVTRVAKASGR